MEDFLQDPVFFKGVEAVGHDVHFENSVFECP